MALSAAPESPETRRRGRPPKQGPRGGSPRRGWHRLPKPVRVLLVLAAVLLLLVLILRLVLDPIASWQTRKALGRLPDHDGDFRRVHVTLLPPGYEITGLKLTPHEATDLEVFAERVSLGAAWGDLLRGRVMGWLRLDEPKLTITQGPETPRKPEPKRPAPAPDLSEALGEAIPVKVSRIEIHDGELNFRARPAERDAARPELWLHRLELVAENLATRPGLAGGRPAVISGHGRLGRSGDVTLFVTADPLASPLSFAGRVGVEGFRLAELYNFVAPATGLKAEKGTVDVFAEFVSKEGMLKGGVKPLLKNVEISADEPGFWDRLKAWMADTSVELASDRVPERNAVATTIPISGRLTDPKLQLWPTILGVVRNAFVRGLASGFTNLPPPTAPAKEGPLTQVKKALLNDSAGPPKAQPENKSEAQPATTGEKTGEKPAEKQGEKPGEKQGKVFQ
jgi:hypothetical protein